MSDPETDALSDERRLVLESLRSHLVNFGTANDAQDHGAEAEAVELRRVATDRIRELLREHAFVAELFPRLNADLGTWRIETAGWSGALDDVERRLGFVHVERIPWDRVVHFCGRASEIPDWIGDLLRDTHAAAERRLIACLVRDDDVAQATPLALRQILGALRLGLLRNETAVRHMAERMAAAARLQIAAGARAGTRAPRVDWSLYRDDRLWPAFESTARDEELWRQWRPSPEERLGWALLTRREVDEHERLSARRE